METIEIDGIKCVLKLSSIRVKQSYNIPYPNIEDFCYKLKQVTKLYSYKRSDSSWKREIIAHNIFYNIGTFVEHTKDTDLDEHEQWWRLVAYELIYIAYKFVLLFAKKEVM